MMRSVISLILLAASACLADTIHYSVTGQFSSDIGITSLTSPNANFSLEFDIPNGPIINQALNNGVFQVLATNVAYTFGSTTPSNLVNPVATFWVASVGGGGFDLNFSDSTNTVNLALQFSSVQIFTTLTTTSQQLLTGSFALNYPDSGVFLNNASYVLPNTNANIIVTQLADPIVPTIPEPSTMALAGLAFVGLALYRRKKN